MLLRIIQHDIYFDIPLRGIAQAESGVMAFTAEVIDEEPLHLADRAGVYSKIELFELAEWQPTLLKLFQAQGRKFGLWRAKFDKGLARRTDHPLFVDRFYRSINTDIDNIFSELNPPANTLHGLMQGVAGGWVFESV